MRASKPWLPAWIAALGVAAPAVLSTAPGLPWLDAGDLVTASATFGVSHPTGFPVYSLLAQIAMLIPLGNLASRMALLSAVCAGAAAGFAIAALRFDSVSRATPTCLAVIFAFLCVPTLAIHSRVPEVYGLQLALVCAGLACLERLWTTGKPCFLHALGLVCGLGVANHALFRGIAPVLLGAALLSPEARHILRWMGVLGALALGCALYLYLPVSAAQNPVYNWGNPDSWHRFWIHVNALEIREAFSTATPVSVAEALLILLEFAEPLWDGLGWIAPLGLLGLLAATAETVSSIARRRPGQPLFQLGVVSVALVGGETLYSVLINPMGNKDMQNGQLVGLILPVAAALMLQNLVERAARQMRLRAMPFYCGLLSSALVVGSLAPRLDSRSWEISRDFTCEDLAVASLATAEIGAMTVLVSDSLAACHLYVQHALAARPDMAVFERNQLSSPIRGPHALSHLPYPVIERAVVDKWAARPSVLSETDFAARCRQVVDANIASRPIYWEVSSAGDDLLSRRYLVDVIWPLPRLRLRAKLPNSPAPDRLYGQPDGDVAWGHRARGIGSRAYRAYLGQQWSYMGRALYDNGEIKAAGRSFALATELNPRSSSAYVNMGVCLAALGQTRAALDEALRALEVDPRNRIAVLNAWRYAKAVGHSSAVKQLEQKARQLRMSLPNP